MFRPTVLRRALAARYPRRGRTRPILRLAAGLIVLSASLSTAGPAAAAPINVNETDDELNADGDCSLREAVRAANLNTAVDGCAAGETATVDVISLQAETYTLSIAGTFEHDAATGDLDLMGMTTIEGADMTTTTVDGGGVDRVLDVRSGAQVILRNLTITGGTAPGNPEEGGGGIWNHGTSLTLEDVAVDENDAPLGGGIVNESPINITGGSVSDNDASTGGGAIYNSTGTIEMMDSEMIGNAAPAAGGLSNFGTVVIERTTIRANTGAPQVAHEVGIPVTITIRDSTISGGSRGIRTTGQTVIENTTISGNSSTGNGGGINSSGATLTIIGSTITNNTSNSDDSGGAQGGGGLYHAAGSQVTLRDTIIAGNIDGSGDTGTDCYQSTEPEDVISQGGNLIGTGDGCVIIDQPSDQIGTDASPIDPVLGTLQNNGGPTETHALLAGSPAIDAGSAGCPPPAADQRGVPRPQGPGCDTGAFETTPPSSSIGFPPAGSHLRTEAFLAGCGSAAADVCGAAAPNPDGAALDRVETRISRASDGLYWNGGSWQPGEVWNVASGAGAWTYAFAPTEDTYTLSSRATDSDGYVESTATATFTIDDTAPETKLTKRPKKKVRTQKRKKRVRFVFRSEEGAVFECKYDRKPWRPCEPPFAKKAPEGRHRFRVRATDMAGNTDPTPAKWRFKVLTT